MGKIIKSLFKFLSFLMLVNSLATLNLSAAQQRLCLDDLIAAGALADEDFIQELLYLGLEKERVLPSVIQVLRDYRVRGVQDPLFKYPMGIPKEKMDERDALLASTHDQLIQAWADRQRSAKSLPEFESEIAPVSLGKPEFDAKSVQKVQIRGRLYAFRFLPDGHIFQDFLTLLSRSPIIAHRLADFVFAKESRIPASEVARVNGEVGSLSEWIDGDEAPSDSLDEVKRMDARGYAMMLLFNFLFANTDIQWEKLKSGKEGWRGVIRNDQNQFIVFDYNLAPLGHFVPVGQMRFAGDRLPDAYAESWIEQLKKLSSETLLTMEFTPKEIDWVLFYRDVILKDDEMRGHPRL